MRALGQRGKLGSHPVSHGKLSQVCCEEKEVLQWQGSLRHGVEAEKSERGGWAGGWHTPHSNGPGLERGAGMHLEVRVGRTAGWRGWEWRWREEARMPGCLSHGASADAPHGDGKAG